MSSHTRSDVWPVDACTCTRDWLIDVHRNSFDLIIMCSLHMFIMYHTKQLSGTADMSSYAKQIASVELLI